MNTHNKTVLIGIVFLVVLALAWLPPDLTRAAPHNTYTVNTTSDENDGSCSDGDCSLRDAIILANTNPGADTIEFDIPPASCMDGVCTLYPMSVLPGLTGGGTTVDGYTQTGADPATASTPADIRVQIDGRNVLNSNGLEIASANNVIRGLAINLYDWNGIAIGYSTATGNVVAGNYLGVGTTGVAAPGNGRSGVFIGLGAANNTVGGDEPAERNILSGNGWEGVSIHGSGTMSNTVSGNYIGTDKNGMAALSNTLGVRIYGGAQNNTLGGDTADVPSGGERNVISGNDEAGVYIAGSGTTGNAVSGNYIGTDKNGTAALDNTQVGVYIGEGAQSNTIGGDVAGERNVISGNNPHGVYIAGSGTTGNFVSGNYIGTDAGGMAALGNFYAGVYICYGAQNNIVGGDAAGERNVISGNDGYGVEISDSGTMSNTVSGNYIGTDKNGTADLGNGLDGVRIYDGAKNNTVGGDTADVPSGGERNVISGNNVCGARIAGSGTTGNTVSGNYIGTDAGGAARLYNSGSGVYIGEGAQNNTIGGDAAGERNVISGNVLDGVWIEGSGTTGNTVSGNYIGTDKYGTADLGNTGNGVYIVGGAQNNTVGGDTSDVPSGGERNVISGNNVCGVRIVGSSTTSNTVSGNYIGTDVTGTADLGNAWDGISIAGGAQNNTVGGYVEGASNIISGNDENGVRITGEGTDDNIVAGNWIGTAAGGLAALGNADSGVYIAQGAQSNTIGGNATLGLNVISGNRYGVTIIGTGTMSNTVSGNYVGTVDGMAPMANKVGVLITGGAQHNLIGGGTDAKRNVISGNEDNGIRIRDAGTTGNVVRRNYIGTDATGTAALGNASCGVCLDSGASESVVGLNLVSANLVGVCMSGTTTMSNTVSANLIGTDVTGNSPLGNTLAGVYLMSGARHNTVGGIYSNRNLISGNGGNGVVISGTGTVSNTILGNMIGMAESGLALVGNGGNGVLIAAGARDNTIGPENFVVGSTLDGVAVEGGDTDGNRITQNHIFSNTLGIHLLGGANGGIATPVITAVTMGPDPVTIEGTACAGCTVEVFANLDADGEGEVYLGSAVAVGGNFSLKEDSHGGHYLTATATDAALGTSEFSAVYTTLYEIYLPVVVR